MVRKNDEHLLAKETVLLSPQPNTNYDTFRITNDPGFFETVPFAFPFFFLCTLPSFD